MGRLLTSVYLPHYVDLYWHFKPTEVIQGRIVKPDGTYAWYPVKLEDGTVATEGTNGGGKYYSFTDFSYINHTVTITPPLEYVVDYHMLCYNGGACTYPAGASATVTQDSLLNANYNWGASPDPFHYADLWWYLKSACDATKPTNLSVNRVPVSGPNAEFKWTPGTNGIKQYLYVGTNLEKVGSDCSTGCIVKEENLSSSMSKYPASGSQALSSGMVYYWRVGTYKNAACPIKWSTPTAIHLSSCDLTPSSQSLFIGQSGVLISGVFSSPEITSVNFSGGGGFVNLTPLVPPVFNKINVTGASSGGPATLTGSVVPAALNCSDTASVTVNDNPAWWRVIDGDVTTNGDLVSHLPYTGEKFALAPTAYAGGFPGVPAYGPAGCGSACTNLTTSNVSAPQGWIANSPYVTVNNKIYDYKYFLGLVPANVVYGTFPSGASSFYGYEWYKSAGNLGVNATAIGTRKVILYVDRNLMVNGNITITSVMS
jgi:hypothetical protein